MTDPWNAPATIASEFASADSFRGRLVLIRVTEFEEKVPNPLQPGKFADRVTATVSTVDGKGPVQIFSQKASTGKYLNGPDHEGVWFSQDRIVRAIAPQGVSSMGRLTLGVIETYKPGQPAGLGNPWGVVQPTEDQKQTARDFLAGRTVAEATPAQMTKPNTDDPFSPDFIG